MAPNHRLNYTTNIIQGFADLSEVSYCIYGIQSWTKTLLAIQSNVYRSDNKDACGVVWSECNLSDRDGN